MLCTPDDVKGAPEDPVKFNHWKYEACWEKGIFVRAKTYIEYVNFEDRCTNCGVCEVICPDQAITIDTNTNWWVGKEDNSFNPKFSNGKK